LKIITHHLGAMVPFLEARVGLGLDQLGKREGAEPDYLKIVEAMKAKGRRPVDYFRMFYGDTAINGSLSGTKCGLDFFGCEHVLFGTDCPFDPEGGPLFIRDIIKVIETLDLSDRERDMIYSGNATRMLQLGQTPHWHKQTLAASYLRTVAVSRASRRARTRCDNGVV